MTSSTMGIVIPRLRCPFPPAPPEHAEWLINEVEEECLAWAKSHRLLVGPEKEEQMRRARFSWLTGMPHPDGIPELIKLACRFMYWNVAVDDYSFDTPQRKDALVSTSKAVLTARSILEDPRQSIDDSDPYAVCFRDVCRDIQAVATPAQYVHLKLIVAEYLMSGLCQLNYGTVGYTPSLEEYSVIREYTGIGHIVFTFCSLVRGFELPQDVWCSPDLQALNRSGAIIQCHINDIYGFHKEASHPQDHTVNLPVLLARRHQVSIQEGIHMAVQVHDDETANFIRIADRLRQGNADERLLRYIKGLEGWIRTHQDWYDITTRYHADQDIDIWALPGGISQAQL